MDHAGRLDELEVKPSVGADPRRPQAQGGCSGPEFSVVTVPVWLTKSSPRCRETR